MRSEPPASHPDTELVDRPAARRWIAAGLWSGIAVASARGAIVWVMDHEVRGLDAGATAARVADRAPWGIAWGLATGVTCAWILRPGTRARPVRVAAAAALFLAVLSGWPFDDAFHVVGPGSTRGALTLGALAAAAFAGALLLAWCLAVKSFVAETLQRPSAVLIGLGAAVALPALAQTFARDATGPIVAREVARDLAVDASAWTVESARTDAPPHARSLTPSLDNRLDGGELPALVMSPPCRVTFTAGPDEAGLRFHAAAGCDFSVPRAFADARAAPRITWRVRVGERVVLESWRKPFATEDESARAWARLGAGDGVVLAAGDRVTLETEVEGGGGAALAVGFGGLTLERHVERARTRASAAEPNVVLVVMDTLRADRTSAHGYARATTPALESLAARGTLFEQAFATSSWTWPSTASLLTGREPAAHGVVSDAECWLADELETLPEVLQARGFTTAAFACNPLVAPSRNFDAGFETFEHAPGRFLTSDQVMPDVLGWLDAHAGARFFLYLHLVDPHELHRARREDLARFAGPRPADLSEHGLHEHAQRLLAGAPASSVPEAHARWLSDAYDAGVASGDHALSQVLAKLDALSLRETTLVVFTSDHGEELLEHGHLQHGQSVHTELVHVPLVLAGPGVGSGARVAAPVSNRHLAATLARAGGARIGADDALDLRGAVVPQPVFLATECGWWNGARDVAVRALRDDGWSLHCRPDVAGGERLYDLRADPGELADVAAAHPDRVRAMRARIDEHERAQSALRPRAVRAGAGTRELLRATGYAGDDR